MRIPLLSLFGALLVAAIPAPAALDFTLQHRSTMADAISVDEVYITDGPNKIFLRIPGAWRITDGTQGLDLIPDISGAQVRLEGYPGTKVLTIDQAGGRELLQEATLQVPKEAKNIETASIEMNPLPIFAWSTMEVVLRYEFLGQPMRRSMMYVSMIPGRVVRLGVVAPDKEFDKVRKQARQFLSSWFEPSRDLPPDLRRKYEDPKMGD